MKKGMKWLFLAFFSIFLFSGKTVNAEQLLQVGNNEVYVPEDTNTICKFVAPQISGCSYIRCYTTGSADTYGFLYDSTKTLIASDNNSGDGTNYCITKKLVPGQTYYIGSRFTSFYESGQVELVIEYGHVFGDWGYYSGDSRPTCTQAGRDSRYCEYCSYRETRTLDDLGGYHDWSSWGDYYQGAVDPTCTKEGIETRKCYDCGQIDKKVYTCLRTRVGDRPVSGSLYFSK